MNGLSGAAAAPASSSTMSAVLGTEARSQPATLKLHIAVRRKVGTRAAHYCMWQASRICVGSMRFSVKLVLPDPCEATSPDWMREERVLCMERRSKGRRTQQLVATARGLQTRCVRTFGSDNKFAPKGKSSVPNILFCRRASCFLMNNSCLLYTSPSPRD